MKEVKHLNIAIIECIGTFFLALSILCVIHHPGLDGIEPIGFATLLIGMIYAGGYLTMAHYNPAVTMMFWFVGKCNISQVPIYLIAQLIGAILANLVAVYILQLTPNNAPSMPLVQGFTAEFLGTFALIWVILHVAISNPSIVKSYDGMAIGLTVMGSAFAFGAFGSYACFNPAVALSHMLNGLTTMEEMAIIVFANLIATIVAILIYRTLKF